MSTQTLSDLRKIVYKSVEDNSDGVLTNKIYYSIATISKNISLSASVTFFQKATTENVIASATIIIENGKIKKVDDVVFKDGASNKNKIYAWISDNKILVAFEGVSVYLRTNITLVKDVNAELNIKIEKTTTVPTATDSDGYVIELSGVGYANATNDIIGTKSVKSDLFGSSYSVNYPNGTVDLKGSTVNINSGTMGLNGHIIRIKSDGLVGSLFSINDDRIVVGDGAVKINGPITEIKGTNKLDILSGASAINMTNVLIDMKSDKITLGSTPATQFIIDKTAGINAFNNLFKLTTSSMIYGTGDLFKVSPTEMSYGTNSLFKATSAGIGVLNNLFSVSTNGVIYGTDLFKVTPAEMSYGANSLFKVTSTGINAFNNLFKLTTSSMIYGTGDLFSVSTNGLLYGTTAAPFKVSPTEMSYGTNSLFKVTSAGIGVLNNLFTISNSQIAYLGNTITSGKIVTTNLDITNISSSSGTINVNSPIKATSLAIDEISLKTAGNGSIEFKSPIITGQSITSTGTFFGNTIKATSLAIDEISLKTAGKGVIEFKSPITTGQSITSTDTFFGNTIVAETSVIALPQVINGVCPTEIFVPEIELSTATPPVSTTVYKEYSLTDKSTIAAKNLYIGSETKTATLSDYGRANISTAKIYDLSVLHTINLPDGSVITGGGSGFVAETLRVKGESSLEGPVNIKGPLTTLEKNLVVKGTSNLQGAATLDSALVVKNTSNLQGAATLDANLFVEGATFLNGALNVGTLTDASSNFLSNFYNTSKFSKDSASFTFADSANRSIKTEANIFKSFFSVTCDDVTDSSSFSLYPNHLSVNTPSITFSSMSTIITSGEIMLKRELAGTSSKIALNVNGATISSNVDVELSRVKNSIKYGIKANDNGTEISSDKKLTLTTYDTRLTPATPTTIEVTTNLVNLRTADISSFILLRGSDDIDVPATKPRFNDPSLINALKKLLASIGKYDADFLSGIAPLDSTNKIPVGYIPGYINEIVEGYAKRDAANTKIVISFHTNANLSDATKIVPATGGTYVDKTVGPYLGDSYRWSGSAYNLVVDSIAISSTPALANGTAAAGSTGFASDAGHIHPSDNVKFDKNTFEAFAPAEFYTKGTNTINKSLTTKFNEVATATASLITAAEARVDVKLATKEAKLSHWTRTQSADGNELIFTHV